MRALSFHTGGFYHIYNRGVEKKDIFLIRNDYLRFLQGLYEFNDENLVRNFGRRSFLDCERRSGQDEERKPIVSLLSFVLMPNHFHLLLQPRTETGVQDFMHRLGVSYSKYRNLRTGRTGRLFESTFKAKEITSDAYLHHIVRYHHLNPVSLFQRNWKEVGMKNKEAVSSFLNKYEWSSYHAYLGKENKSFILDTNLIRDVLGEVGCAHEKFVLSWRQQDMQRIYSHLSET